ncbi:5,10-methylene-tetrahydrofolate dehydrogenase [Buchnera aphidicola (Cinara tujafilina)]|uniref:Bifunctional protein FolD n=1 Tax=Buchnera aphidicola (Cinara tujafilina) TaxID=261317 RepID=F7WZL8_9GAMM|nr:bifunctional methylenetetrahydrofolate dehydrogenase/methenyltetrahydrofolate cyclohydrolase FolD [Buchnera aphidicola]AEH39885.1 5,10-methylene-tetrahydrofolate dehydrogenase [Buchnera aphidicola (Cinara tujafilina)]
MITKIMKGLKISNQIKNKIRKKNKIKKKNNNRAPGLAVILIGNNPSSLIYINTKINACYSVGFFSAYWHLSEDTCEKKVVKLIKKLNNNKLIDGILVQLPLPHQMNTTNVLNSIDPYKDVDGFHPYNSGLLYQGYPMLRACTPRGIITLLEYYNIDLTGLNAIIIGSSIIVGKPLYLELLRTNCTITIANKFTKNLKDHVKMADLIIIAIGHPNFLYGDWIKYGAIVIDVGINYMQKNKKIVGDVHYDSVSLKTSYITPVPGGVGPMTIASLLQNTLEIYEKSQKNFK